jgi:hypothetical protein
MRSWIVALFAALLCTGAFADDALRAHAVHRMDTWNQVLARPLVERVEAAPPVLVDYLNRDNAANGYRERPRATRASPSFIAEVKAALADLPPEINLLFVDKLAGIFLVDNLGGTGYTDVVNDASGQPVMGFIVLDAGVLAGRTANDWATWREATPFTPEIGWILRARIEDDAHDSRRNAIQYILLHELGHVLSIGGILHPPWTVRPKDAGPTDGYTFFNLSWRVDPEADRYVSLYDEAFPLRRDIGYYFGAKLRASQMVDVYAQLAKTNFPALYAATGPGDDFAESFANYVHVVMMKRPWEITIVHGGEPPLHVRACWNDPRCADKRRAIEQALQPR